MSQKATLSELKTYNLEDLLMLHAVIDYENELNEIAEKEAKDKANKR